MKKIAIALTVIMFAALCAPTAHAEADHPSHEKSVEAKIATFESASLKADPAMMKTVAKALAETKGVYSVKLDKESQLLQVVFNPEEAKADGIEKALSATLTDLERKALEDTTWTPKDCGKCPMASKCNKDKE